MTSEDSPHRSVGILSIILVAALILPLRASAQTFPVESTFDLDEEGWSIKIGGVSTWQPTGGNPGGYLQTRDNDPNSGTLISAPPEYLGDWTSLDGVGEISFDIFVDNPDGFPITGPPRVFLCGLSDTASYICSTLPTSSWKKFCAVIDESVWTIESGDWLSLLSDVTEVLVLMDFTNGQDVNGIDNVRVGLGTGSGSGTPDPIWCDVSCPRVCPAGDLEFGVVVMAECATPLADAEVVVDFSACDSVTLCDPGPDAPYVLDALHKTVTAHTDAAGEVVFPIKGGGISYLPVAQVRADGVLLAERSVASCDQDGDLLVGPLDQILIASKFASGIVDPTADLNCDGEVSVADAAVFIGHLNAQEQCSPPTVPSPELSTVQSCLVIEPHGGYDFDVLVRSQLGDPMPGVTVTLDFSACPGVQICSAGAGEPYSRVASQIISDVTGGDGSVTFPIRGGGACADSLAEVRVGETILARRSVASPDQSGDLLVSYDDFPILRGKYLSDPLDPSGDLDCDGFTSPADSIEILGYFQHQCCGSLISPDPCKSDLPACVVVCPGGDIATLAMRLVNVEDVPFADLEVILDLSQCPDVHHCLGSDTSPGPWEFRAGRQLVVRTNVNGEINAPLPAGGMCPDTVAVISARGAVMGRVPVKSPDFDHDLTVGTADSLYFVQAFYNGEYDPECDFNCDGEEDLWDLDIFEDHFLPRHACTSAVDVETLPQLPGEFALRGGYPNPTSGGAVIGFDLPLKTSVNLRVCDVRGRIIRTALDSQEMSPGSHVWEWDGRDDDGVRLSPGVYFYYLETPQYRSIKKAVVLR